MTMTEAQIKHMVDRFLNWKLPENFNPDAGISFKPHYNDGTARHQPVGTNLFNYEQAEAMVRHMIEAMPSPAKVDEGMVSVSRDYLEKLKARAGEPSETEIAALKKIAGKPISLTDAIVSENREFKP